MKMTKVALAALVPFQIALAEVHTILPSQQRGPLVVENRPGQLPLYKSGQMAFNCDESQRPFQDGELPTPIDVARDAFCAEDLIQRAAPNGFVIIFGSAREEAKINFGITQDFAAAWAKSELGRKFPIATGGGTGMMRAGNQGAAQVAGARSLGLPTQFGAGGIEKSLNKFVTVGPDGRSDSFLFASFSQREAEMVDRAVAIVVAAGGVGTAWELFESISKVQTGKKLLNGKRKATPIIFLGSEEDCKIQREVMLRFVELGTIAPDDVNLIQYIWQPDQAVQVIAAALTSKNQ
jgi:predicted Rossmann-fold nucleotide-binding protein